MKIVIYQALILEIIVMLNEVYTEEVYMRNVSELLGTDGIDLTCSYTADSGDLVVGVDFFAMNDTETFVKIAEFIILSDKWRLLTYGEYLFGSVNITKVNHSTSEVVLSFNDLNCKHNRNYRCSLGIYNKAPSFSTPIGIYVQVTPIKPDGLVMISTPINVSMTTEIPSVNNFTFPDYTTDNSSIITTNSYNSSIENNTTNSSNESANIMEGDTITFQCYGNVGKPAGIFIFKKFRKDNTQSTYNATTTEIVEIPGKCSYYRTSYLTFQVTAEDNQAVIRCAVISLLENDDMYVDSEQLEVESDKTTPSTSGSWLNKAKDNGTVIAIAIVVGVVVLIVIGVVVVLLHKRIRTKEEYKPVDRMELNMDQIDTTQTVPSTSSTKKTTGYEDIDLDDTDMKFKILSDEETIAKVKQHNEEYLKKQKEDEEREKDNPTQPPQAAVYACVNKPKNTTTTENKPPADQWEEDVYEESKEGLYDTSGDRRHKENITVENYDSTENLKNEESDHNDLFPEKNGQIGANINKTYGRSEKKEEKRQVATVSPTFRLSSSSQGDGQKHKSDEIQPKTEKQTTRETSL